MELSDEFGRVPDPLDGGRIGQHGTRQPDCEGGMEHAWVGGRPGVALRREFGAVIQGGDGSREVPSLRRERMLVWIP